MGINEELYIRDKLNERMERERSAVAFIALP